MGSTIQNFRNWFVSKPTATLETSSLPLPEEVMLQLQDTTTNLHTPFPYVETIRKALLDAISQWQQQPLHNNVLVILGSPIEPLGEIYRACTELLALSG